MPRFVKVNPLALCAQSSADFADRVDVLIPCASKRDLNFVYTKPSQLAKDNWRMRIESAVSRGRGSGKLNNLYFFLFTHVVPPVG